MSHQLCDIDRHTNLSEGHNVKLVKYKLVAIRYKVFGFENPRSHLPRY